MSARNLKTESLWRRIVQGQSGSGMSVRVWCRKHRVKEAAFYWWRRELARRDSAQPASFVPVDIREDRPGGQEGEIEIILAGGRCVVSFRGACVVVDFSVLN